MTIITKQSPVDIFEPCLDMNQTDILLFLLFIDVVIGDIFWNTAEMPPKVTFENFSKLINIK